MAAFILDIDGTVINYKTGEFLKGAIPKLRRRMTQGDQVIFTTLREEWFPGTELLIKELKKELPEAIVIFGVQSPRIIMNDEGALAINHPRDEAWTYDLDDVVRLAQE